MAEAVRFELTTSCPVPVFKTGAFDHSATPPTKKPFTERESCWQGKGFSDSLSRMQLITRRRFGIGLALLLAGCVSLSNGALSTNEAGVRFTSFYAGLKAEAKAKGYDPALLDAAYGTQPPAPVPQVMTSHKAQPEFNRTFEGYTGPMLSADRVAKARAMQTTYAADLAKAEARTGVPSGLIVALWGIETSYGKAQGGHPIIPALVTLAWQAPAPRNTYFKKELFAALEMVKRTGMPPAQLTGSWAGATGQCQFMPSNYLAYGTDGNGDGQVDIWHTPADVFASAATLMKANGWKPGTPWRIALNQPATAALHLNVRGLSAPHTLAEWKKHGLKIHPKGFAEGDMFRFYQPQPESPAFLVGPNFEAVLKWNKSSYFAFSALSLADMLTKEQ